MRTCLPNWYGEDCTTFCDNHSAKYRCDVEGRKECLVKWYGEDCQKFCDNTAGFFKCNENGDKECFNNWYGPQCDLHCSKVEKVVDLYLCEIKEGMTIKCPDEWRNVKCLKSCFEDEGIEMEPVLEKCTRNVNTVQLCSRSDVRISICSSDIGKRMK